MFHFDTNNTKEELNKQILNRTAKVIEQYLRPVRKININRQQTHYCCSTDLLVPTYLSSTYSSLRRCLKEIIRGTSKSYICDMLRINNKKKIEDDITTIVYIKNFQWFATEPKHINIYIH